MRTIRLRRVVAVLAAALGVLGTTAPSAQAQTATLLVFSGHATLGAALSYPCVGTFTPNPAKCPSLRLHEDLLPDIGFLADPPFNGDCPGMVTNHPICVTGGNTRTLTSFTSSLCTAAGVLDLKLVDSTQPCAVVNTGTGVITGSCGVWSGLINVSVRLPILSGPALSVTAAVHWIGSFTFLLTGRASNNAVVVGLVNAVPVPTTSGTTPPGNSCSSKTALRFELAGLLTIAG